jgi:hypothetical protein
LAATLQRHPTFSEWCVTNKARLEAEQALRQDIESRRDRRARAPEAEHVRKAARTSDEHEWLTEAPGHDFASVTTRDERTVGGDEIEVLNLLSSLVDKSLAIADLDGYEGRYLLLESARVYAREKLDVRGERTAVARRHALAHLHVAERPRLRRLNG